MSETRMPGVNKQRSDVIIAWLKEHDLISKNALCTRVGYDVSSLYKVMSGTGNYVAIPPKYLDEMEAILAKYGFIKD